MIGVTLGGEPQVAGAEQAPRRVVPRPLGESNTRPPVREHCALSAVPLQLLFSCFLSAKA